jgi:hypothetical protein
MGLLITPISREQFLNALYDAILRAAQARQDGGALKVSAALKASTACWGVGRNKNDDHPCITHQNEGDCLDSFNHLWIK